MKTFKRIDENTILLEGVYYTTNQAKKIEVISQTSSLVIDKVRINCVSYYPFKIEK
jgi:hypothetical protein